MSHLWEVVDVASKQSKNTNPLQVTEEEEENNKSLKKSISNSSTSGRVLHQHAKKNFLDGFKHSLSRPKLRSDSDLHFEKDKQNENAQLSTILQNIEHNENPSSNGLQSKHDQDDSIRETQNNAIQIGSSVSVLVDYRAVRSEEISVIRGDKVTVLDCEPEKGYKVLKRSNFSQEKSEGWLPHYVLNLLSSKNPRRSSLSSSWTFKKLRRPSFNSKFKQQNASNKEVTNKTVPVNHSVEIFEGETAVLKCPKIYQCKSAKWKKDGLILIRNKHKYSFECDDHQPFVIAYISNCDHHDSGEYQCVQSSSDQCEVTALRLSVKTKIATPDQPTVHLGPDNCSAEISWPVPLSNEGRLFMIESCKLHSNSWTSEAKNLTENCCILRNLEPGETYGFRVITHLRDGSGRSQPSLPSQPLVVPPVISQLNLITNPLHHNRNSVTKEVEDDDAFWQRDFERQFIELEELGRGRFGVVRKCQKILTGEEVAVKFLNRRKQSRDETRTEFDILNKMRHPNLISSTGLYLTATSDAIVMTLVNGESLFEHLCRETKYTESFVSFHMKQLLEALAFIHKKHIVHLDLKPENLLLDTNENRLIVIDFGSAKEVPENSSRLIDHQQQANVDSSPTGCSPEFMAPEVISKGPVEYYTDMWGVGVLLYVSFSGLSPFLDDSDEETINNILRCDFSFPNEYFHNITKDAKDLISRMLNSNPGQRISAPQALSSAWFKQENQSVQSRVEISSVNLSTLIRRRMKKLNTVAPLGLNRPAIYQRPESIYRT